jgi:hypothetical protein
MVAPGPTGWGLGVSITTSTRKEPYVKNLTIGASWKTQPHVKEYNVLTGLRNNGVTVSTYSLHDKGYMKLELVKYCTKLTFYFCWQLWRALRTVWILHRVLKQLLNQFDKQIHESILRPTYLVTHKLAARCIFKDLPWPIVNSNDSLHMLLHCWVLCVSRSWHKAYVLLVWAAERFFSSFQMTEMAVNTVLDRHHYTGM